MGSARHRYSPNRYIETTPPPSHFGSKCVVPSNWCDRICGSARQCVLWARPSACFVQAPVRGLALGALMLKLLAMCLRAFGGSPSRLWAKRPFVCFLDLVMWPMRRGKLCVMLPARKRRLPGTAIELSFATNVGPPIGLHAAVGCAIAGSVCRAARGWVVHAFGRVGFLACFVPLRSRPYAGPACAIGRGPMVLAGRPWLQTSRWLMNSAWGEALRGTASMMRHYLSRRKFVFFAELFCVIRKLGRTFYFLDEQRNQSKPFFDH